jgi:hypothetical protein
MQSPSNRPRQRWAFGPTGLASVRARFGFGFCQRRPLRRSLRPWNGPSDVYDVPPPNYATEIFPDSVESRGESAAAVPLEWARGVDLLQRSSRPLRIPAHRWSIFIDDSRRFLAGPWAALAAKLGWDTEGLFASRFPNPHEHLGGSGLIWNLAGGQISRLHRDGAAFVTGDGSARTFHRWPDRTMTFLPWQESRADSHR